MIFFEGKHIPLDENGHLVSADDWSEGLARTSRPLTDPP